MSISKSLAENCSRHCFVSRLSDNVVIVDLTASKLTRLPSAAVGSLSSVLKEPDSFMLLLAVSFVSAASPACIFRRFSRYSFNNSDDVPASLSNAHSQRFSHVGSIIGFPLAGG